MYHVPTGFGFSPKASGFYPFGDATDLAGEGGVGDVVWMIQASAWNQTCHSTNDRSEALASLKGCFLCFCFSPPQYLCAEPYFRTGGILWTSLRRRYGISIGISDSIGEMVCRGQKSILSCWRPNIDVSSHGLMCHESVYRSSYIRCWRILTGFRCSEYSDERQDYLYGVGENQPSVVYHQSNACCIQ